MMDDTGDRPRLLVLTSTFPRWADDHEPPFVYELCHQLIDRFAITVIAPHAPGSATRENLHGIDVVRFRYAPERWEKLAYAGGIPTRLRRMPWLSLLVPGFMLAMLFAGYRQLRSGKPQAVHAHWLIPGGLVGALLTRVSRNRPRLLITAHGGDIYGLRGRLATLMKRWVLTRADQVTVVSAALADAAAALGCPPQRISVLPMGTDLTTTFVPQKPEEPAGTRVLRSVVYAGRLVDKKGIDTLLQASAIVLEKLPGLRLTIAGHGPALEQLRALSRELGIERQVEFTGPYRIADLPRLYADAELAVFPFRMAQGGDQDGFGLALVEAMGCGVPVVGSDIAPLDDLLIDGVTGLRATADDANAFAAAIIASLDDPPGALDRARAARSNVLRRYDWPVIAARYAELLLGK